MLSSEEILSKLPPIRGFRRDITGKRFGRWVTIKFVGAPYWECKCDCGTVRLVSGNHLRTGHSKSCGCLKTEKSSERLSFKLEGQTFGQLFVIRRASRKEALNFRNLKRHRFNSWWLCQCECGNKTIVAGPTLVGGRTKSCGCRQGYFIHGKCHSNAYHSWVSMKNRCLNPNDDNYRHYGGRGIRVCERWLDFTNFYSDMGERLIGQSLGRLNVNGDYEPSNCRWESKMDQPRNTRRNKIVEINGQKMLLCDAINMLRSQAEYLVPRSHK